MPDDEVTGEILIPRECIVAGVGGHICEQVRVVGKESVRQSTRFNRSSWIAAICGHIRADVSPKQVTVSDEIRLGIGPHYLVELRITGIVWKLAGKVREVLDMHHNWNTHL